jgi:hypothetical protein
MPKQPKPTKPRVDLREDALKEITVSIRTSVYESILQYAAFHKETMGSKPSESKVVDRGMEEFFASDDAFDTYRKKSTKKQEEVRQPVDVGEGGKGGGPSNTGRLQPGRGTSL